MRNVFEILRPKLTLFDPRKRRSSFAHRLILGLLAGALGLMLGWFAGWIGTPARERASADFGAQAAVPSQKAAEAPAERPSAPTRVPREPAPPALPVPVEVAASVPEEMPEPLPAEPAADIENRLAESVRYLSSDELQGRGIGTEGIELAAQYVAQQYADIGLDTWQFGGTPFQEFQRRSRLDLGPTNELVFTGTVNEKPKTMSLTLGKEFTPISLSSSGTFDLPLVFVGYGITSEEAGYDDYEGLDVTGKAVIVLRHEPERGNSESAFNGAKNSEHGYIATKITNAVDHGAAAVILCTDEFEISRQAPGSQGSEQASSTPAGEDPLLRFRVRSSLGERRLPVVHCQRAVVDQIVEAALGRKLDDLEGIINENLTPHSRELSDWRVGGQVSILRKGRSLKNVVGVLEAKGPRAKETVVLGAHYDHLGLGGWGSLSFGSENQIHNGADDNASGTAVLIEVARQLMSRRESLARRIIFIAFTAEEMGLVGSEHYVRDPLVPLDDTVAMVNLDMVGRLRKNRLTISGMGPSSLFAPLINRLDDKHKFVLAKQQGGYGPSDHASFYGAGIPVLHFFTGLHGNYHRPSDDFETVNVKGMRRIALMVADVVAEIANAEESPKLERPDSMAAWIDKFRIRNNPAKTNAAFLGVVADKNVGPQSEGYLVRRVIKGSPAAAAGVRAGDVVTQLGDQPIRHAKDLVGSVGRLKPGAKVLLTLKRGAVEMQFEITMARHP
jgi:hypothetical protein